MAAASPARAAAARENSKKSTGPRSTARTSRNAVKHGLSGQGISLLPEDRELLEHRIACWAEELGAVGDLEHALVVEAASASVRRRRAEITEADRAAERVKRSQAARLRAARARMAKVEDVEAGWNAVVEGYRRGSGLTYATKRAIAGLVGETVEKPGAVLASMLLLAENAACLDRSEEARQDAGDRLWCWLLGFQSEAESAAEACREAVAEAEAEGADPSDGWLDGSQRGELLRRYIGAAGRDFHRALAELNRTRRLPDSPVEDGARNEAKTGDGARTSAESWDEPSGVAGVVPDPGPGPEDRGPRTDPGHPGKTDSGHAVPAESTEGTDTADDGARNEAKTADPATVCGEPSVAEVVEEMAEPASQTPPGRGGIGSVGVPPFRIYGD